MPLFSGWSKEVVSANIAKLCEETGCHNAATHRRHIAAALNEARRWFRAEHPGQAFPAHLRPAGPKRRPVRVRRRRA